MLSVTRPAICLIRLAIEASKLFVYFFHVDVMVRPKLNILPRPSWTNDRKCSWQLNSLPLQHAARSAVAACCRSAAMCTLSFTMYPFGSAAPVSNSDCPAADTGAAPRHTSPSYSTTSCGRHRMPPAHLEHWTDGGHIGSSSLRAALVKRRCHIASVHA